MANTDSGSYSYSLHMAEQEEIYQQKIRGLERELHWAKVLLGMCLAFYEDRISTELTNEIKEILRDKH